MSDPQTNTTSSTDNPVPPKQRGLPRRLGCYAAVALWFLLLLTPCLLCTLATRGQITVPLGSAPSQELRVWLINEADQRGIGIARPSLHAVDGDRALCVQIDVSFVLWAGTGEAATFCECYTRGDDNSGWVLSSTSSGTCPN